MLALLATVLLSAPDAGVLLARPVEVTADSLQVKNKEQRAVYSGHAKVVRDSTTITCDSLTAEYGSSHEVTRILAHGNVEAVDGARWAHGDEAVYDNSTGVLVVQGSPVAREGAREVSGELVTFTTGTDQLTVTKAKTRSKEASHAGAPSEPVSVDADLLTFDNEKSKAQWSGHVRARRGTMTMTAPLLTAFSDEHGVITRVQATGGVEATDGTKWARGQRADYDAVAGVLVVTGKPEARQGANRMRGTKVTWRSGGDSMEVENVRSVIEVEKKKGAK